MKSKGTLLTSCYKATNRNQKKKLFLKVTSLPTYSVLIMCIRLRSNWM